MKRFLIFVLLGPLLGGFVVLLIVIPIQTVIGGEELVPDYFLKASVMGFMMYPVALSFGIVPALMACFLDAHLAKRNVRFRWAWCGLFGLAAGFPFWNSNIQMVAVHWWWPLVGGLIGAIPAVICSLLSSRVTARHAVVH